MFKKKLVYVVPMSLPLNLILKFSLQWTVLPAGDIYGNQGKVGDGTLIRFFDPGHIMLPNMKDFL